MADTTIGIVVNSDQIYDDSLPMASLGDGTFLEFLLDRVSKAYPDAPKVLAMGFWDLQRLSDRMKALVESYGFEYFVGDRDYGARLLRVARHFGFDHVVDVDVLHPLTSFHFCDSMIESHLTKDADITAVHNLAPTLVPTIVKKEALSLYASMCTTSMLARHSMEEAVEKVDCYARFMKRNPGYFSINFTEAPIAWPGAGFDPFIDDFMGLRLESPDNFVNIRNLVYTLNKDDITSDDVIDYMLILSMRRNWDQETMFDTRYTVVDQDHMSTPESFDESARVEIGEFVFDDKKYLKHKDVSKKSILEVGCGMGRLIRHLADSFGEVHGTDGSPQRFMEARYRLRDKENITVTQADGRSLVQYQDDYFDYTYAHGVFVHINSKQVINNYIHEMGRVLKKGGRTKFDIYHGDDTFGIGPRYFGVGARYTEEEVTAVAEAAGMKVVAIDYLIQRQYERGAENEHSLLALKQMKVICEKK